MNFKNNIIDKSVSIKKVINIFHKTNKPTVFITSKKRLVASVTDGDIRRAILKNINLETSAYKIANKKPKFVKLEKDKTKLNFELKKKFNKFDVKYIPVLKNRIIQDVIDSKKFKGYKTNFEDVVIMAGGKGKRLLPLTKKTPKSLLKINKKTLLKNIIDYFISFGFSSFKITVNHFSDKIIKNIKTYNLHDYNIEFIKENKPLGTVGGLSLIKNISENFVVINADLLTMANINDMLDEHKKNKSDITIGCIKNYKKIEFGVINLKKNTFENIEEKPIHKFLYSAGIYIFKRDIKNLIPKNKKIDMPNFINSLKNKKINLYPIFEKWIDIGTLDQLSSARKNFRDIII